MANYSTLLKTWGDTGTEYPSGYAYLEGEQPVDAWDNFLIYNVVDDLDSLISLTNGRIETDKGASGGEPASPESSHLYHDTDSEALEFWDATSSSWHRLLAADGDSLEGALDFGNYAAQNVGSMNMTGALDFGNQAAQNVGPLNMSATADLDGNDLVDGAATIWDSTNSYIPQNRLQNDSVTVSVGSGLSGGGTVALGSSITLDVTDGSGSALDADTVDGKHATDVMLDVEEDGTLHTADVSAIDFGGHLNVIDDLDGTVTIDPTHNHTLSEISDFSSDSKNIFVQSTAPGSPSANDLWIDTA